MKRGHIELITALDEAKRGGKARFLSCVATITPEEARMLSDYADVLKNLTEAIIKNQKPIDKKHLN